MLWPGGIVMRRFAVALLLAVAAGHAAAQEYPTRPVTLVVPNAPGGFMDVIARVLQPPLQSHWKQTVLVDYKPGAGTALGTAYTAKAVPDGYTISVIATPHVINPAMQKLSFDTVKDLSGVAMIGTSSSIITASPSFPVSTFAEALALIRKNPGKYSYASPGVGSSMHLAMELLKQRAGLDLLHVPFKGSSPAYPEVFSGRVDLLIDPLFPTLNHVKAGKLKALALTGSQHPAVAPDISLIADLYPGFNVPSLFGLVVASSTPREVVHKLHADVSAVLREPPIRKRLDELGLDPHPLTPEQFDALIKSEVEGWIGFVRKAGISKD
jgi:tripartite-type tricarboxylate transporter receptor subunit TctC